MVSKFGYHVQGDDYELGLQWLLESDCWLTNGEKGRRHMERVYDADRVADLHIREYEKILEA